MVIANPCRNDAAWPNLVAQFLSVQGSHAFPRSVAGAANAGQGGCSITPREAIARVLAQKISSKKSRKKWAETPLRKLTGPRRRDAIERCWVARGLDSLGDTTIERRTLAFVTPAHVGAIDFRASDMSSHRLEIIEWARALEMAGADAC
jgi:hypothetical protein